MRRKNRLTAAVAALLWLLCIPRAAAAEYGSLEVSGVTEDVLLYCLYDNYGKTDPGFSGAAEILQNAAADPVKAAQQLAVYAGEHGCEAAEQTPDQKKTVLFSPLPLGTYLVCSEGKEFAPFLLHIPTLINQTPVFHMQAKPKVEDIPQTTAPPAEQENTDSKIPQTGVSVIPKYTLMGLGTVITLWGLWEMLRGREDAV